MKTPITWLELLKKKFKEIKEATGKSASVSEVAGDAKKEWIKIKEGTHNKYIQGKSLFFSKKHKTKKHHASSSAAYTDADIRKIVAECPKCSKKLTKCTLKNGKKNRNLKGGTTHTEMDATHTEMDAATPDTTPEIDVTPKMDVAPPAPDVKQSGGKKGKRKSRKNRK